MSVYSNTQILKAVEEGHILCHPFNPKNVSHASMDVTLGYYYYRIERQNERTMYNPLDREDVEDTLTARIRLCPTSSGVI